MCGAWGECQLMHNDVAHKKKLLSFLSATRRTHETRQLTYSFDPLPKNKIKQEKEKYQPFTSSVSERAISFKSAPVMFGSKKIKKQ